MPNLGMIWMIQDKIKEMNSPPPRVVWDNPENMNLIWKFDSGSLKKHKGALENILSKN